MTGSQEWKDADFFGKVDIAWDKIIAEPFMSWAGSEGKSMLSQGIGKLFPVHQQFYLAVKKQV